MFALVDAPRWLAREGKVASPMKASLRFLLLGIALILFGVAFPELENGLLLPFVYVYHPSRVMVYLLGSIFPVAGLIVAFVGFFKRD